MPDEESKPTCFIAMPITTRDVDVEKFGGDDEHWLHVMDTLFVPAVEAAGFQAIPPATSGSHMIHSQIIKHLSISDMVLCDLSSHNPNVFFELGVRTSLNLPITLVRDEYTTLPFDTAGLNTHEYKSTLQAWDTGQQVDLLAKHIRASVASSAGTNPLWRHFGLKISAEQPDPQASSSDAQIALIYESLSDLRREVRLSRSVGDFARPSDGPPTAALQLADKVAPILGTRNPATVLSMDGGSLTMVLQKTGVGVVTSKDLNRVARLAAESGFELTGMSEDAESMRIHLRPAGTD